MHSIRIIIVLQFIFYYYTFRAKLRPSTIIAECTTHFRILLANQNKNIKFLFIYLPRYSITFSFIGNSSNYFPLFFQFSTGSVCFMFVLFCKSRCFIRDSKLFCTTVSTTIEADSCNQTWRATWITDKGYYCVIRWIFIQNVNLSEFNTLWFIIMLFEFMKLMEMIF